MLREGENAQTAAQAALSKVKLSRVLLLACSMLLLQNCLDKQECNIKDAIATEAVVMMQQLHTSFGEQVGSELGCDGLPALSLAVCPGIAKVWHDCCDGTS